MTDSRIFRLAGTDVNSFLQGLVTNDVAAIDQGLVYAALLTPQGKFIADFFLTRDEDGSVLMDVDEAQADMLLKRLTMYKLRADVEIADSGLNLQRGTGERPEKALSDPRHSDMGWRAYSTAAAYDDGTDWDAIRVAHCIPKTGIELTADSFILEAGFEALHGVDFRKGCYVGQEVTARMKHKTTLRKGLRIVSVDGSVPAGSDITAGGKPVGTLFTQSHGKAIAYLRLDRAGDNMVANGVSIRLN
jgi:tRNA-modifying protein YgfZ